MTSKSPSAVTFSTLPHQAERGLRLSLSGLISRSNVQATSAAVNGLPSCHRTPCRSLKASCLPSPFHDQLVARSGTIESKLFLATFWSNITRLLNSPMNGTATETVASSWIDALGGVSMCWIFRTPPAFCAQPAPAVAITNATTPANAKHPFWIFMLFPPSYPMPVTRSFLYALEMQGRSGL